MLGILFICISVWFCYVIFHMGHRWGLEIINFVGEYVYQSNMPRKGHDSQTRGGPKCSNIIKCQLVK
jgi:hypothetical protein